MLSKPPRTDQFLPSIKFALSWKFLSHSIKYFPSYFPSLPIQSIPLSFPAFSTTLPPYNAMFHKYHPPVSSAHTPPSSFCGTARMPPHDSCRPGFWTLRGSSRSNSGCSSFSPLVLSLRDIQPTSSPYPYVTSFPPVWNVPSERSCGWVALTLNGTYIHRVYHQKIS